MPSESTPLSTAQVAKALGVSVSTVKRWVDEGLIPAAKTPGKHRKVHAADVLRFAKESNLPHAELAIAQRPKEVPGDRADVWRDRMAQLLLEGDESAVRSLVRQIRLAGVTVEDLADLVVSPALSEVGHQWASCRIDVWEEHRATQICAAALFAVKTSLQASTQPDRPVAIGGAPEGDPYLLANLLIESLLLENGWAPVNLGPNTPFASLEKSMDETNARLVWLSVSHVSNVPEFKRGYDRLFSAARERQIPVVVGGSGLTPELRASMGYTFFGDGLRQLASFLHQIHPRPAAPRRGRPPKRDVAG